MGPDPKTYRELQEPVSPDAAQKNIEAFSTALESLRREHHISELFYVVSINVSYPEGEADCMLCGHHGAEHNQEHLAAFGFGHAAAQREHSIAQATIVARKRTKEMQSK